MSKTIEIKAIGEAWNVSGRFYYILRETSKGYFIYSDTYGGHNITFSELGAFYENIVWY